MIMLWTKGGGLCVDGVMSDAVAKPVCEKVDDGTGHWLLMIRCPGCGYSHGLRVLNGAKAPEDNLPHWWWNGDLVKPTFQPSLLCHRSTAELRCHSWIKDGKIMFLSDSHHALKNQTVDLPVVE